MSVGEPIIARAGTFWLRAATDGGGGAELRSIYGGVLLALGENRDLGGQNAAPLHVDIPLRRARLELDGLAVVENGHILDRISPEFRCSVRASRGSRTGDSFAAKDATLPI